VHDVNSVKITVAYFMGIGLLIRCSKSRTKQTYRQLKKFRDYF